MTIGNAVAKGGFVGRLNTIICLISTGAHSKVLSEGCRSRLQQILNIAWNTVTNLVQMICY